MQQLPESEGYPVETASNGQSAWENLAPQPVMYAVALIDREMPRMTGRQLLQALKQLEADWVPPLLVMSANSEALQRAIGIGASHLLEKPFDQEAVVAMVAMSLARHR